ncbi:MAG: fecE [Paenibacillus sp.]|nr:fecE [Paenibacillus sp.]
MIMILIIEMVKITFFSYRIAYNLLRKPSMKGSIAMNRLYTQQLDIAYDQRLIVQNLSLSVPTGKITALVGANGSGKSTILKAMARIMKPKKGNVYLDGKSIHQQTTKEVAKQLAILPQNPVAPEGLTVSELVSYGRFPHQKGFGSLSKEDKETVQWAIEVTGMEQFADRPVDQLSGGQRQRAWIAMALAQQTDILFLDEPTTFLDMAHQLEVLKLLQKLNQEEGRTIVMVVHDLNHATRYAQHVVAIVRGEIVSEGSPVEVVTKDVLRTVFNIEADILHDPRSGVPLCLPFELSREGEQESKKPAADERIPAAVGV